MQEKHVISELRLNDLRDKPRATKKYKRVGRGKSNSPGHGGKGQTARTGVALGNFQGGQTPIERRLPKQRTFYTPDKMASVSLKSLDRLVENKYITSDTTIDFDLLRKFRVVKKAKKFKLVGVCAHKFSVVANAASKGAEASIAAAKGSLTIVK